MKGRIKHFYMCRQARYSSAYIAKFINNSWLDVLSIDLKKMVKQSYITD